jgi:hypothetical protein
MEIPILYLKQVALLQIYRCGGTRVSFQQAQLVIFSSLFLREPPRGGIEEEV